MVSNSKYVVDDWSRRAVDAASFLETRYETSLFLLGNLESFGSFVGESPNSGNFKIVSRDWAIAGVFCLTKRGNLLVQGDDDASLIATICDGAKEEPFKIAGVLGPWPIASAIWDQL